MTAIPLYGISADKEMTIQLDVEGEWLVLRVWQSEDEMSSAPQLKVADVTLGSGFAGFYCTTHGTDASDWVEVYSICIRSGEGDRKPEFRRGDVNADGKVDLSDAVSILGSLFLGEDEPDCQKSADTDDSGSLELTDAVYLLNYLFLGAFEPPAPFPACGLDPTEDDLSCESFPPCL